MTKHINDPDFRYVCSAKTDIRKTFAKERKRLAEVELTKKRTVTQIRKEKK